MLNKLYNIFKIIHLSYIFLKIKYIYKILKIKKFLKINI